MKVKVDIICPNNTVYYRVRWWKHWWSFFPQSKWCQTEAEAWKLAEVLRNFKG